MLDVVWIGIAFLLGFGARLLGLPPLVGFLGAGFVLHALDVHPGETLEHFAEIGITLLLFSIGLKLKPAILLKPQVWAVASLHAVITVAFLAAALLALAALSLPFLTDMEPATALLLGFALSFSSTVFAVKVLEEKGEMSSIYGITAIGILIVQDIAAVAFLAASIGKVPSPWALLVLGALIPLRPILLRVMDRSGHGELLILFGLSVALGGAQLFDLVNIKGDLGALVLGVMLSNHKNANELAKSLLGFKDLFLVGFFLTIGLGGTPGMDAVAVALVLVALVPAKSILFCWLLSRFRMRARTAFLASLSLSNYSEFGLIVAAVAGSNGWLSHEWLATIALALALSFAIAAPLNSMAHRLYERLRLILRRCERGIRLPEEESIDPGKAGVLIFGMGRVGTGAYDALSTRTGQRVVGVDLDPYRVAALQEGGRQVVRGSATDPDFWARLQLRHDSLRLVMLAMPRINENLFAADQLKKLGFRGEVVALAKYEEDIPLLQEAGVDRVFNLYAEAGVGFADHALRTEVPAPSDS